MLRRIALLGLALILVTGCTSKAGLFIATTIDPLEPERVVLSDGYLANYYQIQKGDPDQTETLLFFIGGSGRASLNYYLDSYFADLPGNVRIFALQKRHVGHWQTGQFAPSAAFDRNNHYPQWIDDQRDFIRAILDRQAKLPQTIVLFGVSEGGNVAARLAAELSQITHLLMLGSGGMVGMDEFRLWGQRHQVDFDAIAEAVKRDPGSIQQRALGQTYKYWASVLPVDPMRSLRRLSIPILVAIGERDEMVPVESVRYLGRRFEQLGKDNLTIRVLPGCNHRLDDSTGENHRKELLWFAAEWWAVTPSGGLE